jgi:hypothetical protein
MTVRCLILIPVAALAIAGCSRTTGSAPPAATAGGTHYIDRENIGEAIELLNRGEVEPARKVLWRILNRQPGDQIARQLVRQLDTPPETLLGKESFAYTTRAGDTMSTLAGRFLRDPMMFYALARYNGIAAPATLEAGRALRIPGRAPEPAAKAAAKPETTRPAPTPAKEAAAAPKVDSGQASRLRARGLEQLNRGAVDRAVSLLQQASRLDPGSSLIRRDLDRAQRIQKTVRGGGA